MEKLDFNFVCALSRRDSDIAEHLLDLYAAAVGIKAKVIVEVGAGQSTFALTAAAKETKGHLWSIDWSQKAHLRLFPAGDGILEKETNITFIVGNDMQVVSTWDREIDFLLIDGDHTYEHVVDELNIWPDKVRTGGIIAMHDTGHQEDCGVRRALDEWLGKVKYPVIHLQDTKHIGLSFIPKI